MKKNWSNSSRLYSGRARNLRIMKILTLLMLVCSLSYATSIKGQKVDVFIEDGVVLDVLEAIEKQCDYRFAYSPKFVDMNKKVSINVSQMEVTDVLDKILTNTDLSYVIDGEVVVLRPKSMASNSQQDKIKITGTITDERGEAIPGASIIIKGTSDGTITDTEGNFVLTDVPKDATLIVSFIGQKSKEVDVNGKSEFNITLEADVIGLDEVIAVGYGIVKKSDLTGAVSQVKSEEITSYPALDMNQAMQGRAAGVMVQAVNGAPGADVNVRIRGYGSIGSSSNPLYVIDGFPGGTLPPVEDIESIEILKDASATAIYGSRGANGVVMVTTKRGKKGKPRIEFKTSLSLDKEISRIDLLDKDEFVDYISDVNSNFSDENTIGSGTDWQDEIFRTGLKQDHKLSFSGGNDELKYYVSASMYDQKGVIINSRFKRYSITSNLDIYANDKINLGVNLFGQRTCNDGVRTQESTGGTDNAGVITSALTFEPTLSVFDSDGSYTRSNVGDPTDNPVAIAKERRTETVEDRMQANVFGEYTIIPDLKFKTTIGANIRNQRWGYYVPTTLRLGEDVDGDAGMGVVRSTQLINENYLTYTKEFGGHNITAMAGYSYESYSKEVFGAYSQGFITDSWSWWNLDGGTTYNQPNSSLTESELQSYYGRINYKLFDKYLITLNGRYDGSSVLAEGHKWTFFPSGAIAWNVMEESFMDGLETISQLKVRLSYGISGNQSIAPYQSLANFQTVQSVQNSSLVNAVRPISVANKNLTWEEIKQTDIGINLGLFNQRLSITADYYVKESSNLLFKMPLPEYSGYSEMWQNIGGVENKGVELSISTVNFDKEFKWVTDFNISTYKNEVLVLPEGEDIHPSSVAPGHMVGLSDVNIIRVGEPVGMFYGYVYDGVIQSDEEILPGNFDQYVGGEKYKDINGRDDDGNLTGEPDGKIDGDDRTIIGNPHPDFIWGINNSFSYKGFDLNIFIQGSQGNDIYSFTLQELETMGGTSNSTTEALKRWTPENTDTDVPIASSERGYHSSSRWVFDGSYIRLKTVALGYNLPANITDAIGVEKVRFSVSAQNLLTITDYRGFDPEVNYNGSNSSQKLGFDYGSYPNCKSITFGLNVIF